METTHVYMETVAVAVYETNQKFNIVFKKAPNKPPIVFLFVNVFKLQV